MLIRFVYLINYVLGRDIAGRTLAKFPDDIFLVAYPGSGGQWLRRLVGNLMDPRRPVTESNVMRRIPDLYHMSRRGLKRMARPRIIFSHECIDAESHTRVIYLVRDPRDVAVSNFEQCRKGMAIDPSMEVQQFVSTIFMQTNAHGWGWAEAFSGSITANTGWGYQSRLKEGLLGTPASWGENVMSWLGGRGHCSKTLLMVRYEDLAGDPVAVLTQISDFMGIGASAERIHAAVAMSAATTPETPGSWRACLPAASASEIESVWGPLMAILGYAPAPLDATITAWRQA